MATKKKLLEAAAGSAGGGAALNIEDVFSAYLYEGNGTSQTITNGIDLSGEGGAVIFKSRTTTEDWHTYDTQRGTGKRIALNQTTAQYSGSATYGLTAFNSDGFSVGTTGAVNGNGINLATYTFRKAPKFFDVVTWTGSGSTQSISHNLDSQIGFMAVKATSYADNWYAFHRQMANPYSYTQPYLRLNGDFSVGSLGDFGTSVNLSNTSSFQVSGNINLNGVTYVAYLFAHNNGDGEFGPDADQDIIKCGSYAGNGSADGNFVDLGFEPQWVMVKRADAGAENWAVFDNMRFMVDSYGTSNNGKMLKPNNSQTEEGAGFADILPTGFKLSRNEGVTNQSGGTYIYIAIRRGPMAVPESATDVFEANSPAGSSSTTFKSGNTSGSLLTDFVIGKPRIGSAGYGWLSSSRLNQKILYPHLTAAEEGSASQFIGFDTQSGINWNSDWVTTNDSEYLTYHWKRAPSFCDVVTYTGNATAGRTVSHNLGVAPEMIWVKQRDVSRNWTCYFETLGTGVVIKLNDTTAAQSKTQRFDTAPTDSVFYLGNDTDVNSSGGEYIAYLFASLDGISKVGSYTGTGSSINIDCGFSSGARFVLIKRTDSAGAWWVVDTERGIVSGNDPLLRLNTTDAEYTGSDVIDPYSSGFTVVTSSGDFNTSGGTYIFYAIA